MSYQIRKSDGTLLIDLRVGETDNTKSPLTLIGKNVSNFGQSFNQNQIRLLENFAAGYEPPNSIKGQLWFNTTNNQLFVKTATGFSSIGPFSATTTPVLSDRSTLPATTEFVHSIVPAGSIIMWYGVVSTIPAGWALCDGRAQGAYTTPDLRDKFVMGAGSTYAPRAVGGRTSINTVVSHSHTFDTVTDNNSRSHSHGGVTASGGIHQHAYPGDDQLSFANGRAGWTANSLGGFGYDARSVGGGGGQLWQTTSNGNHTHTFTTGDESQTHTHSLTGGTNTVGSATVDILNPFYALCYIMKVV